MTKQDQDTLSINVQDIAAAVQVIDVATSRGAWQGAELSSIGTLRDKFAAFVQAASEQIEAARADQEGEQLDVDATDDKEE